MEINIDITIDRNGNIKFYLNVPFEYCISNEEAFLESTCEYFYTQNGVNINRIEFLKHLKSKIKNISSIFPDYIGKEKKLKIKFDLCSENTEYLIKFIKENKDFKICTIVDTYKCEKIINGINLEEGKNLYLKFQNGQEFITYDEFYKTINELYKIVNFVKKYNLSNIEKILLVYDIIKANKYNQETSFENYSESRDLSKVVNGDKIVCLGYANLINFILGSLKIKNNIEILKYKNKQNGHARNIIFVDDDKYNVKGQFICDCTWDSKKNNNYLDNYNFFLKRLSFFAKAKEEVIFKPNYVELLKLDDEQLEIAISKLSTDEKRKMVYSLSNLSDKNISNLYLLALKDDNLYNETVKTAKYVKKLFNQKISKETFKNALYKIRKIEYLNGIINEDITEEKINDICNRYYRETGEILLLKMLDMYKEPSLEKSLYEAKAKSVKEDILRLKLAKTLKIYLNDLPDNKFINKMK